MRKEQKNKIRHAGKEIYKAITAAMLYNADLKAGLTDSKTWVENQKILENKFCDALIEIVQAFKEIEEQK